jgi:predicted DNA-binding ribbon-helix-helix protein
MAVCCRFMERRLQKSLNMRRNTVVGRHRTSVSLEKPFWESLQEIAATGNIAISDLLLTIDSERHDGNLSSAIRVYVLEHYRERPQRILIDPTA